MFLNQWISFIDENGKGFAQTDQYLVQDDFILLFEDKYTQTNCAFLQMEELYVPLLEKIYGLPVMTLQVCKNTQYKIEYPRNPEQLIENPEYLRATWNFIR